MDYAQAYRDHVAKVEEHIAVIAGRRRFYERLVAGQFDARPPSMPGTDPAFVVDSRMDADREANGAKSARDRNMALATMYGLGALIDLFSRQGVS